MFMEFALLLCLSVKGFFCNEIILSRGSEHPHYVNDYTAKCITTMFVLRFMLTILFVETYCNFA